MFANDLWSPFVNDVLPSVVVPGFVSATVTVVLYLWIQRPRADLKMIKINPTIEVAKWLERADRDDDAAARDAKIHWRAEHIVLVTNYGDGTAYDISFEAASDCRPRVFVRDTGQKVTEDADSQVVAGLPMWSDRLAALKGGCKWSVVVMTRTDRTSAATELKMSWTDLPLRWGFRRATDSLSLADADIMETGWPGKSG